MKKLGGIVFLIIIVVIAGYGLYRIFSKGIESISTGEIGGITFFVLVLLYFVISTIVGIKKKSKQEKEKELSSGGVNE